MQHGFRCIVPRECVGDRTQSIHESNLFDMNAKNGDVVSNLVLLKMMFYLRLVPFLKGLSVKLVFFSRLLKQLQGKDVVMEYLKSLGNTEPPAKRLKSSADLGQLQDSDMVRNAENYKGLLVLLKFFLFDIYLGFP